MPIPTPRTFARSSQSGISLIVALLALTVIMIATLALSRTTQTGARILGNIGFKQDATAAADRATRKAIDWMIANPAALAGDDSAHGYYARSLQYGSDGATPLGPLDVTGGQFPGDSRRQLIDWNGNGCAHVAADSRGSCNLKSADAGTINGNAARYIIFRLCSKSGDYSADNTVVCSTPVSGAAGAVKRGELNQADSARLGNAVPFFRIVVRVEGARNTTSFTETVVHF